MDIIGVGESGVDLILAVEKMPGRDEKVRAREIGKFPGGMIGNFCSAAAKLGAKCGIVSALGDDANGRIILRDYEERGIDTGRIYVEKNGITFYCVVFLDADGEKYLTAIDTPLNSPPIREIDFRYLRTARFVHMNSMNLELVKAVVECLKGSGTKISLDYEGHADMAGLEKWQDIFKEVSVLFINEEGAGTLSGNPEDTFVRLCKQGTETIVMTCGEKGGVIFQEDKKISYKAFKAEQVIDTTGAGDCFNAAFLTGLIREKTIEEAVEFAAAAAALSVQKIGARSGQPTEHMVRDFIQKKRRE